MEHSIGISLRGDQLDARSHDHTAGMVAVFTEVQMVAPSVSHVPFQGLPHFISFLFQHIISS
jgi:hypothetical protein